MSISENKPEKTTIINEQKAKPPVVEINLTDKDIIPGLLAARASVESLLFNAAQAEKFLTIVVTNEQHASKIRNSFWRSLFYPAEKVKSEMDKKFAAYHELIVFAKRAEVAEQLLGALTKTLTAQGYQLPAIAPEIKTYATCINGQEKLPDYAVLREQAQNYKNTVDKIINHERAQLSKRGPKSRPNVAQKGRGGPPESHEYV